MALLKGLPLQSFLRERTRKFLARKLALYNFSFQEIREFLVTSKFPTIELRDGTTLSSFWSIDRSDFLFSLPGIPTGFEKVVFDYVLRYKYPHFQPARLIHGGWIPRRFFPIHPQHKSTVFDLPYRQAKEFSARLTVLPSSTVLEAGCFIGFGTIQLGRLTGPSGFVYSMEIAKENWELAQINIQANHIENVTLEQVGLGDRDCTTTLFRKSKQATSIVSGVVDHDSARLVNIRRLDSVMKEKNLEPNFIVLTVNGAELAALDAAKDYLATLQDVRIIVPGWYRDSSTVIGPRISRLLQSIGYKVAMTKALHVFAYKE